MTHYASKLALALALFFAAVSATEAGHWTKWWKPGLQNTGGKRDTADFVSGPSEPASAPGGDPGLNYRIASRQAPGAPVNYGKYDDVISNAVQQDNRTTLLQILRALARDTLKEKEEATPFSSNYEWVSSRK